MAEDAKVRVVGRKPPCRTGSEGPRGDALSDRNTCAPVSRSPSLHPAPHRITAKPSDPRKRHSPDKARRRAGDLESSRLRASD